jgi:alpha-tubulin suppressor-like RCC1 family protein
VAYCWGVDDNNQLGNGVAGSQASPGKVSGGHLWTDIAAGQVHTCGIDGNQKLYCWGRGNGFIGLGPFGSPIPAVVLPAYNWSSVQTQGIHTCAQTVAGETYCWGSNTYGQLGIGNTDDFGVPRILVRGVFE